MATKSKKSPKVTKATAKARPVRTSRNAARAKKATNNLKASNSKKTPAAKKKPLVTRTALPPKKSASTNGKPAKPVKSKLFSNSFLTKQRDRLLALKDTLLDSMNGVAKDSLRSRADGSEASAFGQHQADAGSDAYDKDFALSLLSSEQDSLYEIDQALKRIEDKTYGICEMSNKAIPQARLEAIPFARYTVECQAELEKRNRQSRVRQPITSLFGFGDEDHEEGEDDDSSDSKD